jgi:hypothetical protein
MAGAPGANPARDISPISQPRAKGAHPLTIEQLRTLLAKLRASDYYGKRDQVDPVTGC